MRVARVGNLGELDEPELVGRQPRRKWSSGSQAHTNIFEEKRTTNERRRHGRASGLARKYGRHAEDLARPLARPLHTPCTATSRPRHGLDAGTVLVRRTVLSDRPQSALCVASLVHPNESLRNLHRAPLRELPCGEPLSRTTRPIHMASPSRESRAPGFEALAFLLRLPRLDFHLSSSKT